MFKCKTCEVLNDEVKYLKKIIDSLHEKLGIPVIDDIGDLKEDYREEPQKVMNTDGHPAAEVHDE